MVKSLGFLFDQYVKAELGKKGFSSSIIIRQWSSLVGEELADICQPRRLRRCTPIEKLRHLAKLEDLQLPTEGDKKKADSQVNKQAISQIKEPSYSVALEEPEALEAKKEVNNLYTLVVEGYRRHAIDVSYQIPVMLARINRAEPELVIAHVKIEYLD